MANTIKDLISSLKGGRFALTFLDYAKSEDAVEDELMIDKSDPAHNLYFKTKTGEIKKVGGDLLNQEDLVEIQQSIDTVARESNEYSDQLVADYTTGGPLSLFRYEYTINVTVNNTTTAQIPLSTYSSRDFVMVSTNTVIPSPSDGRLGYTISPTGLITFKTPFNVGSVIYIVVLKNIPVGEEGSVDAHILLDGSIDKNKLSSSVITQLDSAASSIPVSRTVPTGNVKNNMMWYEIID